MIYIRTDMNEIIATGHMMRCMAIADAARKKGEETTFLLADSNAESLLKNKGYRYIILDSTWTDMEGELEKLLPILHREKPKRLLVDSYQVTAGYLLAIKEETEVVYLDDLNSSVLPVDAVICYAIYADKFGYEKQYPNSKLYLGTKYTPLRNEFSFVPEKKINKEIESVLVLSGGTDRYCVLERVIDRLLRIFSGQIDAVCGILNENYSQLAERYRDTGRVRLHRSLSNIAGYMQSADLAISAGGTTLYELCACGTPAISYAIADNQLDNVQRFDAEGLIFYAGDARSEEIEDAVEKCYLRYQDAALRADISHRMQSLVDGKGAPRIAEILIDEREQ